jgi:hypothetical protein
MVAFSHQLAAVSQSGTTAALLPYLLLTSDFLHATSRPLLIARHSPLATSRRRREFCLEDPHAAGKTLRVIWPCKSSVFPQLPRVLHAPCGTPGMRTKLKTQAAQSLATTLQKHPSGKTSETPSDRRICPKTPARAQVKPGPRPQGVHPLWRAIRNPSFSPLAIFFRYSPSDIFLLTSDICDPHCLVSHDAV